MLRRSTLTLIRRYGGFFAYPIEEEDERNNTDAPGGTAGDVYPAAEVCSEEAGGRKDETRQAQRCAASS